MLIPHDIGSWMGDSLYVSIIGKIWIKFRSIIRIARPEILVITV